MRFGNGLRGGMAGLGSSRVGLLFLILLACITDVRSDDHDAHDHDAPWEWIGAFALEETTSTPYTFVLEKVDGEYAAPTALISMHSTDDAGEHGIEHSEQYAEAAWETTPTAYAAGDLIIPGRLYQVTLDASADQTILSLSIPADGAYLIVFEHDPAEFEDGTHYLQAPGGGDVDPGATEPAAPTAAPENPVDDNHLWLALAANTIVTACSLIGILTVLPCIKLGNSASFTKLSSSFACGTLMAAAVFIMIPEAKFMVDAGASSEAQGSFNFGISLISGFLLGALMHWCTDVFLGSDLPRSNKVADANPTKGPDEESLHQHAHDANSGGSCLGYPAIVWSVLVGDFFHNITDGVAISVAFRMCSTELGWIVMAGSMTHELSSELADYLILTTVGKMSPCKALLANFASGASSIIIGLVASSVDMSNSTLGIILAFGSGTFLWIIVEAFPKELKAGQKKLLFGNIALFLLGVGLVAVVLLFHVHCGGHGDGDDEDDGHNH